MGLRLGIAISASVFCFFAQAGLIPFGFWKTQNISTPTITIPTNSCASISGTQTFASNTNIDDAAITTHQCKHWVVNTGVTLTFQTNTQANIGDLTLNGTAVITPLACTTSACYSVNINSKGNVTIASSAKIHADAKGYLGGYQGGNGATGRTYGNTTTGGSASSTYSAGGSYAGVGGDGAGGEAPNSPYGSISAPVDPGSGGACHNPSYLGGNGGGVIRLIAQGTITIEGIVSANGGVATTGGGGGSGGSVWITASTIATSTSGARVTANGAASAPSTSGGGGGGRIALEYNSLSTLAINSTFVQTNGIKTTSRPSSAGTIYTRTGSSTYGDLTIYGTTVATTKNTQLGYWGSVSATSATTITMTGNKSIIPTNLLATKTVIPNILASTLASHNISSNTSTVITTSSGNPTTTTSANRVWVVPDLNNRFDNVSIDEQYVDAPYLKVENALTLSGGGNLYSVYIDAKTITVSDSSTMITTFAPTTANIFKLDITATDVNVGTASKIDVSGKGYLGGLSGDNASYSGMTYGNTTTGGAASMTYAAGGSHAGIGGMTTNSDMPNNPYGSISQPTDPGSGGAASNASYSGGNGGGVIRMNVSGTLSVTGAVSANGGDGGTGGGGGAGGSIWVTAGTLTSPSAAPRFYVNGGSGNSTNNGHGGGGRIAIEYTTLSSFVINSTYIRALGVVTGRQSSSGTIFAKGPSNTFGDLYIFSSGLSGAKNIQIGYFGYVSARTASTITMTGATSFVPTNGFSGKTVIPNVLASTLSSHNITSNTSTVITTSSGDPTTTTSVGMMWAVPGVDNEFDDITIVDQKVDAAYLKAAGTMTLQSGAVLAAVHLDAATLTTSTSGTTITTFDPTITNVFKLSITGGDIDLGSLTKINLTGKGYLGGYSGTNSGSAIGRTYGNTTTGGPAIGATYVAGASHGGMGGSNTSGDAANAPYGSITAPVDAGTGGSVGNPAYVGGNGGGIVRINITGNLNLDGIIEANGGAAGGSAVGGAAGGSIWITANSLEAGLTSLRVSANGAAGGATTHGSGGGGRIAVEYNTLTTITVTPPSMTAYTISAAATTHGHAGTIYGKQGVNLGTLVINNNSITGATAHETRISQSLNLLSLTVAGNASVKQMSVGNTIAVQNAVTVTSPALMKVPNNGTTNNTGPWTWFTYGSLTGTITEY